MLYLETTLSAPLQRLRLAPVGIAADFTSNTSRMSHRETKTHDCVILENLLFVTITCFA